jgi:hypothetical protein
MDAHTLLAVVYEEAKKKKAKQGAAFAKGKYAHNGWRDPRPGDTSRVQIKTMCIGGYALCQLALDGGCIGTNIVDMGNLRFVAHLERKFASELSALSSILGFSSYARLVRWNDETPDTEMLELIRSKLQS